MKQTNRSISKKSRFKIVKLNFAFLCLTFVCLSLYANISFWFAFAKSEGSINSKSSFIVNLVVDSFWVVRFPTHTFFSYFFPGPGFFLGLYINAAIYSILLERLYSYIRFINAQQ